MNAPADAFGQSPAHLAACGGEAFFLLWQLQTGANLNQQVKIGKFCSPTSIMSVNPISTMFFNLRGFIYTVVLHELSGVAYFGIT